MKFINVVGVALALAMSVGSANAATTYSFTGSNPDAALFDTDCSIGGFLNTGCAVTFTSAGAGVDGFGFGSIPDTQPGSIDSFPLSFETLIINFAQPFTLLGFELGNFSGFDDFEYSLDGGTFFDIALVNPMLFGPGILTSSLAIRASSDNFFDLIIPDAFTLKSITGVAAVPVPAGLALLGSGLVALGFLGRRKRNAQAA